MHINQFLATEALVLYAGLSRFSPSMNWPVPNATLGSAWHVFFESVTGKIAIAIIIVVLCQRMICRPKKRNLFPVYATVEIAVASYILRGDGLGRRIL